MLSPAETPANVNTSSTNASPLAQQQPALSEPSIVASPSTEHNMIPSYKQHHHWSPNSAPASEQMTPSPDTGVIMPNMPNPALNMQPITQVPTCSHQYTAPVVCGALTAANNVAPHRASLQHLIQGNHGLPAEHQTIKMEMNSLVTSNPAYMVSNEGLNYDPMHANVGSQPYSTMHHQPVHPNYEHLDNSIESGYRPYRRQNNSYGNRLWVSMPREENMPDENHHEIEEDNLFVKRH